MDLRGNPEPDTGQPGPAAAAAVPPAPCARRRFPWRAVAVALLLIPFNAFWVLQSEIVHETAQPTMASLIFTAVWTLLFLAGVNVLVGRWRPTARLRRHELLLIYSMVALASAVAGHDQVEVLVPVIGYAAHHASPGNQWEKSLLPLLPAHLTVTDRDAAAGYWNGRSTLYTVRHLAAWAGPILWWLAFFVVMAAVMVALCTLFHQRWSEHERLPYPLLAIPVEIVDSGSGLLRSRVFWGGFLAAGGIDLLNGLHLFLPGIPSLHVTAQDLLPSRPTALLQAFGYMPVAFYPWAIGLGLLLPVDFLLSCWVFFWIWKAQRVVGAMAGLSQIPRFPYVQEQAFGAYIAIGLCAVWLARGHLRHVLALAAGAGKAPDGNGEGRRYRWALATLGLGFPLLVAFAVGGGMSLPAAVAYFAIFLCLSLSFARVRGEMGVPAHDLHSSGPDAMMVSALGTQNLTPGTLAMFSVLWWMTRAHRSHPMPHELEGLEMGRRAGIAQAHVVVALVLAVGAGMLAGSWAALHLGYHHGASSLPSDTAYFGLEACTSLDARLANPRGPDLLAVGAIGLGTGATLLCLWMRNTFLWWPLHPIGYAVSSSLSGHILWMPMFLAWAVKHCVLRFGGARAYRSLRPLAFGLILGEFVVGGSWSLVGWALDITTYRFWSY